MRTNKKIILILLLIIATVLVLNTTVFADNIINVNSYKPGPLRTGEGKTVTDKVNKVLGAIRNLGIIISVIVLSVIGLKYMLASVEEKSNYKENMLPYIIGCLLLMFSSIIPSMIYSIFY